jgi:hypothetical protein
LQVQLSSALPNGYGLLGSDLMVSEGPGLVFSRAP